MGRQSLSVVMPVYNEKDTVLKIIDKVLRLDLVKELIVIDDGSTDGTREVLKNSGSDARAKVVFHEKNMGKGAALRTGFKYVSGDIVVIQDADLEYDPNEFKEMIKPIEEGNADVVYGSRLSGGRPQRMHLFWHKAGNDMLTFVTNISMSFPALCQKRCILWGLPPDSLEPYTTSAFPSSIGFIISLNSFGSYSRSASCITTTSPDTYLNPVLSAAPFPMFFS